MSFEASAKDFEPVEVTAEMKQRFEGHVQENLDQLAEMWRDSGEDPDSEKGQAALENVRQHMLVPSRPEWMPPARAVGVFLDDLEPCVDLHDAMRTRWSMTEKEWAGVVGRQMGISTARIIDAYKPKDLKDTARNEARMQAPTMLYRHYDADGQLLYVGITLDLKHRNKLHVVKSPWWDRVADTTVEWFSNRHDASKAERDAVRDEEPVFNDRLDRRHDGDIRRAAYLDANS